MIGVMQHAVELRQLRYFVAVAEELHFGRAALRLHMSQSPLSRAIRELERDLGVVLFVRTTRRVELTAAGAVLLERGRRVLTDIDAAIVETRRAAHLGRGVLGVGYGPFSRPAVERIAVELAAGSGLRVRFEEDMSSASLRRVASRDLAAAVVMESPGAARRHGVRIDTLRDEPLLAAMSESHPLAGGSSMPMRAFVAECVLLPAEPPGQMFNAWLESSIRAVGQELGTTKQTMSAAWDRRMLPIAAGEAVCPVVAEWTGAAGVVAMPFDPPLSFRTDLATCWPPADGVEELIAAACRVRNAEAWLTERPASVELPGD
jgi:DNA-binding transcriptional LysR family regulator